MRKRILALMIAVMLAFGTAVPETLLLTETVQAAEVKHTFSPQKAVEYADKYWSDYNDLYPNYSIIGGDCADFVSQCLYAGGLPMNASWYHAVTGYNRSANWTYAQYLYTYLSTYCGNAVEIFASSSSKTGYKDKKGSVVYPSKTIRVGDPVFYYNNSKKRYGHVAICVGFDSKGNPLVSAHNTDHSHVTWTLGSDYKHWAVIQMKTEQTISGRQPVPSSALTYKGELWKSLWQTTSGKQIHYISQVGSAKQVNMYLYKGASASSGYITTYTGGKYSVLLSTVMAVSEKKQVGNELWGKILYNGISGWVLLQKGNFAYAKKITAGNGATVNKPTTSVQKITGITLDTTEFILAKNSTKTIKVKTYKPSNASVKKVTWSSSNPKVATVDANGKVKGSGQGTATITATAADGSGIKASCKVKVSNALYKITYSSVKVRYSPRSDCAYLGITLPKDTVVPVDTVKSSGKEKWGKVTYGGRTGWFCITKSKVYAKAISEHTGQMVTKITLNRSSAELYGKNSYVTVSVKSIAPGKPAVNGVVWSTSNVKVATVSTSGKVVAVSEGTAVITATAKDGSGVSASCKVTVRSSKPGKPSISSLKNSSGKKITVKLSKKVSGASGYEVEYCTSSGFKSNVKKTKVKSTSCTLSNLTKGKTYYVRVRAYKTDKMGTVYGSYSSVKSLKVTR